MVDPVSELNRRNIAAAGQPMQSQDYSIPYGQPQPSQPMLNGGAGYNETNGWLQDEYGQWHQDPSRNAIYKFSFYYLKVNSADLGKYLGLYL